MPGLPTITLDTTLADLYRRACPGSADKRIAQVLCGVSSRAALSANVPRNAKYLYQDTPFNTAPPDESRGGPGEDGRRRRRQQQQQQQREQQRQLAVKYLSLIPQRDAFISGATAVVLFHTDETEARKTHDRREAERTLSVLARAQRPDLVFCAGPSAIPVEEAGIDLIAYKLVLDGLAEGRHGLVVPPDTHWFLNSKAALARSGLPTPRAAILEVDGLACEARLCCAPCAGGGDDDDDNGDDDEFVIPRACTGSRGKWLEAQTEAILAALASRPLPFVLKNQQTFGGAGTYVVATEAERGRLAAHLRGGVLRRLLSSVTAANVHLRPAALVLSDLVEDPVGDYGLTFFVAEDGGPPVFLAASEQLTDDARAWVGSTIDYARQDELKGRFGPLVDRVAAWLRGHGYVGPAGADVLETAAAAPGDAKRETDCRRTNGHRADADPDFPDFHVVDLNVRTSGSLCLPLLRRHFTSRGLMSASSFSISYGRQGQGGGGGRDGFVASFRDDLAAGRMCIVSWYEDPATGVSLADIAVGAEDERGLREAMRRVRDATEEVTF
ncbi:hypothetical protein LX36DRAFT_750042 [Colletotrichum falcatum]|nr:hypothetical protein LX36DRAFT_750042 [Colletotrichum falcatum]